MPAGVRRQRSVAGARQPSSVAARVVTALAAVLSFAVLAGSVGGWAGYRLFSGSILRLRLSSGAHPPPEAPGDVNILLIGTDSRAGTAGEYGSQAEVGGLHSDTTIIAHLGADGRATLLSVPRDTLVTAPPDTPHTPADGRDKLTNVLADGGIGATVATLQALTGLRIDHFVLIDLAGFKAMTDAVGGVTVCVAPLPDGSHANLNDNWSQWHGRLGQNHLDGDQALAFVRTRHALGDERLRILRQQQFLAKLLARATSAGVLTNPVRIASLLAAVGGSLQVDQGLSTAQMLTFARRLHGLTGGAATFVTLPTHVPTSAEGAVNIQGDIPPHGDVLLYSSQQAEQILAPLRPPLRGVPTAASASGPTSSASASAAASVSRLAPGKVHIAEVRNDTGRKGLASRTARALRAAGFAGDLVPVSDPTTRVGTIVRYGPAELAPARDLAAAIPGARIAASSSAAQGLVLVLGTSFSGLGTALPGVGTSMAGPDRGLSATPASPTASTPVLGGPGFADTSCTP